MTPTTKIIKRVLATDVATRDDLLIQQSKGSFRMP